jgi:hypothetical protein
MLYKYVWEYNVYTARPGQSVSQCLPVYEVIVVTGRKLSKKKRTTNIESKAIIDIKDHKRPFGANKENRK